MAKTANERLAEALNAASECAIDNILHSKNIKPLQQALLVKHSYLKSIIKGWYLLSADMSSQEAGESALWYESLWAFLGQYLTHRFKDNYWLSVEASLDILTDNNSMPAQIVVFVKDGTEIITKLPNNMSLMVTRSKTKPDGLIKCRGVKIYSLEMALSRAVPMSFRKSPLSMQIALSNANLDKLVEAILHTKNAASAGRLVGAYNSVGMRAESKKLQVIMEGIFEKIKIVDPFLSTPTIFETDKKEAASASRVRIQWQAMRQDVLNHFEESVTTNNFYSRQLDETLDAINELYVRDAYNSLSIEGYKVTPELIKKVSRGDWSPATIEQDRDAKNALAARGYYDAFNQVKSSISEAYNKEKLAYLVDVGITQWYTSLFRPCVTAGLINEVNLAGYRKGPIYIRGSQHVPPASEQLMDCMTALRECIVDEESFAVKAILGHLFLGYIHPYPDGNGRTARFLMNFLFVLGGYNWVVIKQEMREQYLDALESASVHKNIGPFIEFILDTIRQTDIRS